MLSREELENAFKEANHILDFLAQDLPHKKNQAEHLEHKLSPDEEVRGCIGGITYMFKSGLDQNRKQLEKVKNLISSIQNNLEMIKKTGNHEQINELIQKLVALEKKYHEKIALIKEIEIIYKRHCEIDKKLREEQERYLASSEFVIDKIHYRLWNNYRVDTHYCDVFEESLLSLAEVKEMPTFCYYNNKQQLLPTQLFEEGHSLENSIFFRLGLSQASSVEKLMHYATEKKLEPFDYTYKISKEEINRGTKYIRLSANEMLNILCNIESHLAQNPAIAGYYRAITLRNYKDEQQKLRSKLLTAKDQGKIIERLQVLDNGIGDIERYNKFLDRGKPVPASSFGLFKYVIPAVVVAGAAIYTKLAYGR